MRIRLSRAESGKDVPHWDREVDPCLQSRKLPLESGSRRFAESEKFASGTYRRTGGGEGDPEMSCAFRALQLQRLESSMS